MLAPSLVPSRRGAITVLVAFTFMVILWLNLDHVQDTSLGAKLTSGVAVLHPKVGHRPAPVLEYFNQVFSVEKAPTYDFPALRQRCDHVEWKPDVYMDCNHFFAGMTSIMSEVKTCLKMAIDGGTGLILPKMPLRDSTDLKEFNFMNADAYMSYENWFDVEHLVDGLSRACPKMNVLHSNQLEPGSPVKVKHNWAIDITSAPGYHMFNSHFWAGRPFKDFFNSEYERLVASESSSEPGEGISVIKIGSIFLLFRITDDPTRRDLKVWNDLGMLIRFLEKPRTIVNKLITQINQPYYGVHFRVENDTIWSSLEHQLSLDLDALDQAWVQDKAYTTTAPKPLVYLACGDESQMQKFVDAGKARGWTVTHKWDTARASPDKSVVGMIDSLAFDFQGAVDMGIMIQSQFFIGISGSAFSSTVAHVRDITGRYRGSSLTDFDDEGARSHIFNDGDPSSYACCL